MANNVELLARCLVVVPLHYVNAVGKTLQGTWALTLVSQEPGFLSWGNKELMYPVQVMLCVRCTGSTMHTFCNIYSCHQCSTCTSSLMRFKATVTGNNNVVKGPVQFLILSYSGFSNSTVDCRFLTPVAAAVDGNLWKKMCRPMLCNTVPISGCLS